MNCWHCDRPSHAACFFCGRGVCKDHVRSMPGVLELFRDRGGTLRGLVVDAVMWCGICDPKRYPVNLDAVDPAPLPTTTGVSQPGDAGRSDTQMNMPAVSDAVASAPSSPSPDVTRTMTEELRLREAAAEAARALQTQEAEAPPAPLPPSSGSSDTPPSSPPQPPSSPDDTDTRV